MTNLERYLNESQGIYTIVGNEHMILLPFDEPLTANSFDELMGLIDYHVAEWDRIDQLCSTLCKS